MKTDRIPILNRAGTPPADGWYQIEVSGEHPAPGGRVQVIDTEALTAMANRFATERAESGDHWPGLLVDADHLSHDREHSTEALAWLQELEVRDGQLWGRLDLTDIGDPAIRNKRFKFFSTEYAAADLQDLGNGRVRPLRLSGLALTNRPNNRGGKPISNRDGTVPPGGKSENTTDQTTTMTTIAERLGLPPEATEAEVLTAIDSLLEKVGAMETKEAEAEADAVLNRLGDRVPEAARPQWRAALIANRAEAEPLMEASFPQQQATPAAPVFNRASATAPAPLEGSAAGSEDDRYRRQGAAVTAIRNREKCDFQTAWNMARGEHPDLF